MVPTPDPPPRRWYSIDAEDPQQVHLDPFGAIHHHASSSEARDDTTNLPYIVEILESDTAEMQAGGDNVRMRKPITECKVEYVVGFTSVPAEGVIDVLDSGLGRNWPVLSRPSPAISGKVPLCLRLPVHAIRRRKSTGKYVIDKSNPIREFDFPPLFVALSVSDLRVVTESGLMTRRHILPMARSRDMALEGFSRRRRREACVISIKSLPQALTNHPLGIQTKRLSPKHFHSLVAYWPVPIAEAETARRVGSDGKMMDVFPSFKQISRTDGIDVLTIAIRLHVDFSLNLSTENTVKVIILPQMISSQGNLLTQSTCGVYEVNPWLLAGSCEDEAVLTERGVTHLTGSNLPSSLSSKCLTKVIEEGPFDELIETTSCFIDSAREKNGKCLIFADKEALRVVLLVGYFMRDRHWQYADAMKYMEEFPGFLSDGFALESSAVEQLEKLNDMYAMRWRGATLILDDNSNCEDPETATCGMKILLIQTHGHPDVWGIPGGTVSWRDRLPPGADAGRQAALREAQEETGVPQANLQVVEDWDFQAFEKSDQHSVKTTYRAAFAEGITEPPRTQDKGEVADVRWFSIQDVLSKNLLRYTSDVEALTDIAVKMGFC
eukprot:GEMP01020713.1.p1 GENE.GEMP01020713.1~~GEMP01020713.1.p1  ORF type:complete len:608 (+),score=87.66 GEMP01020713.1:65-1888(+)